MPVLEGILKTGFKFCFFKRNMYRYGAVGELEPSTVGLYKLNPVDPQLESTRFRPLNL
jgi:hypothetical protein